MSDERCPVLWNPGVWPYLTRCVLAPEHPEVEHVNAKGEKHRVGGQRRPMDDAIDAIIHLLTSPDHRSPSLHRDKLRTLAMEWPALAAALGRVVAESGRGLPVPEPLRRAQAALAKEAGK